MGRKISVSLLCFTVLCTSLAFQEHCVDDHIWLEGSYGCDLLMRATHHGFHHNRRYWCHEYPLTECCATCRWLEERNLLDVVVVEPANVDEMNMEPQMNIQSDGNR
ncbi:uncharacterized protein LOC128230300 [Mya arenaria]|uniref:uncharacterized protein LOC128230300 n=1 Tax=Mya arenaria TaxID=6604 RepID=UPI0022DF74C8|nr:uncharacterized protein LOC128230300 [Mya arenaria]